MIATCCWVKLVPHDATTFSIPAWCKLKQSK